MVFLFFSSLRQAINRTAESLFSTPRKSQLASSQPVLSNIVIGCKFSQRACELAFAMIGKEPYKRF
jgi:hypothetical protein